MIRSFGDRLRVFQRSDERDVSASGRRPLACSPAWRTSITRTSLRPGMGFRSSGSGYLRSPVMRDHATRSTFEMTHALRCHDGQCANIHDHSDVQDVTIAGPPAHMAGHSKAA